MVFHETDAIDETEFVFVPMEDTQFETEIINRNSSKSFTFLSFIWYSWFLFRIQILIIMFLFLLYQENIFNSGAKPLGHQNLQQRFFQIISRMM